MMLSKILDVSIFELKHKCLKHSHILIPILYSQFISYKTNIQIQKAYINHIKTIAKQG